ncbi:MAG: SpoIVB peptidase [Lachnospiraceae bacterium]
MKRKKRSTRLFIAIKTIGVFAVFSSACSMAIQYCNESLPSVIRIQAGEETSLSFDLPITGKIQQETSKNEYMEVSFNTPITVVGNEIDSYEVSLELLGVFELKNISLQVVEEAYLIPGGIPIGIYIETQGVMVVDTGEVETKFGVVEPSEHILAQGDYILAIDGNEIDEKAQLTDYIDECDGEEIILTISRLDSVFDVAVTPVMNLEGDFQLGIWIKDNAQGIGTLTYMAEDGSFGALGHPIHDSDTGEMVLLDVGTVYKTNIISVTKGSAGQPGELTGMIDYQIYNIQGDIYANSNEGIFGALQKNLKSEVLNYDALEVGYKHEVTLGDAQIICTILDERVAYDIEIVSIDYDAKEENKAIQIKVIDQELLELTGGIIQGMSGSPILQNGKIIGAVTHVMVNDPTRGYGIFIENMLETAESVGK